MLKEGHVIILDFRARAISAIQFLSTLLFLIITNLVRCQWHKCCNSKKYTKFLGRKVEIHSFKNSDQFDPICFNDQWSSINLSPAITNYDLSLNENFLSALGNRDIHGFMHLPLNRINHKFEGMTWNRYVDHT